MYNDTDSVFDRFTGQLTASDPLQTLFQLLSGRTPAVAMVKEPKHQLHMQLSLHHFCSNILKMSAHFCLFKLRSLWCVFRAVGRRSGETGDLTWLWCSPMRQESLRSKRRASSPWETLWVMMHTLTGWSVVSVLIYELIVFFFSSLCSLQRPDTGCTHVLPHSRCSLWGLHAESTETCSLRQQPQVSSTLLDTLVQLLLNPGI